MDWQILLNTGLLQVISTLVGVLLGYRLLRNLFEKLTKKPSQHARTRRRLGKLEAYLDQLSQERGGTANVCLIVSLKSKTKLLKEHVCKALLILAKRQPLLRAIMTSIPSESTLAEDRYIEIIDGDKIPEMINFTSVEVTAREWQDVWHEIATEQRGTGLLWQAVILQEEFLTETENYINTLIFKMHPSICDGFSSIKLCKQFFRFLNDVAEESRTNDEDICSFSLLSNLCDLLKHERPWSLLKFAADNFGIPRMLKSIIKSRILKLLSRKQINPFFVQFPPSRRLSASFTPRSKLLHKVFSESETSKILTACKSNGSTVNCTLMVAAHMAFCELIREGGLSNKDCYLEHRFSINAQQNCHPIPPEEYLGQFSILHTFSIPYTVKGADFWTLARESTQRIDCELKEEKHITENMPALHSLSAEELVDEVFGPSNRGNLIKLSSCNTLSIAGSIEFGEEEKHYTYKLHECLYNCPIHGLATTFGHFIATVNGKMSWVILYDPSRVTLGEAEEFSTMCFNIFLKSTVERLEFEISKEFFG